ncbi:MAG: hypothetical protein WJ289_06750 [Ferrovum myxofaciens]|uniref:hypothetical protein n=1 Tax=Ferrovum myxofaciens TaxID=416213 RepID=UPI003EB861C1
MEWSAGQAAKAEQCELAFRQVPKYSSRSNDSISGWTCDRNRFNLLSVPFAIPQAAIASLLPDELSWVQRQVSELSGRLARQPTDWRSALPAD